MNPIIFKVGDVVVLRHGGLPMTVEYRDEEDNVCCVYFSTGDKLHRDIFHKDMLKLVGTK